MGQFDNDFIQFTLKFSIFTCQKVIIIFSELISKFQNAEEKKQVNAKSMKSR